jgi:hypothetical protein
VGTAYGCLQDTERFLDKMVTQEEQMLTPTAFIQSTHNTVSGQIALLAKCNGHNLTYVHRGHSFEHALINAKLYLNEHKGEHMFVGGLDELTPNSVKILQQAKVVTSKELDAQSMVEGDSEGAVAGEGAAFFSVTDKPISDNYIKVSALDIFTTQDEEIALEKTKQFLKDNEVDTLMLGVSARKKYSAYYNSIKVEHSNKTQLSFKNLCGEYPVASSFALGLLFDMLNDAKVSTKRVALINNFGKYYSNWMLELSV